MDASGGMNALSSGSLAFESKKKDESCGAKNYAAVTDLLKATSSFLLTD